MTRENGENHLKDALHIERETVGDVGNSQRYIMEDILYSIEYSVQWVEYTKQGE